MKTSCRLKMLVAVAGLAVLASGSSANANLVVNGSFELGAFVDNSPLGDSTMNLLVGSTALTGWNIQSGDLAWIQNGNPFGLSASDGQYFLDLSGYHDNQPYGAVAASALIATTIGQQYRVTFDLGSDATYNNASPSVEADVTGLPSSATFTAGTVLPTTHNRWESFGFVFTATGTSTTLSFSGVGVDNQHYVGLDNVSLVAVPEPTTMIAGTLLLLPFAASTLRMLRKNRG